MRTILTRYVTFELIKVFLLVLCALTLVILIAVVIQEAVRQGLGLVPILRLVPFIIPNALRFAVPATALLVATMVYGRMAAFNEVVAIKSMGISPWVVLAPALWMAVGLSVLCVWLNDVAVSWGRAGVQRVIVESVEQIVLGMLKSQRTYSSGRMSLNVQDVVEGKLVQPTLTLQSGSDDVSVTITARLAELQSDTDQGTLTIRFYDAVMDVGDGRGGVVWPGAYEYVVQLSDFSRNEARSSGPSAMALNQIPDAVFAAQRSIDDLTRQAATTAAYQLMTGDFGALTGRSWKTLRTRMTVARERLNRLRTEPHRRWANGLSCFCFVAVGATMSIRRRNSDFMTSFFVCFAPILLIYYPLLALGVDRSKAGAWPPQVVWLGNAVLLLWGAWLLRRVLRH